MSLPEQAGIVSKSNWNSLVWSDTPIAPYRGFPLVDENGTASGAMVWWNPTAVYKTPIMDAAGSYHMMKGYLDGGADGADANATIRVWGLSERPNGYDVYIYADGDNGSNTRTATYQISGTGITTTRASLTDIANTNFSGVFREATNKCDGSAGNYLKFRINATGFTLTAFPGAGGRALVNGIQIVPAAQPGYRPSQLVDGASYRIINLNSNKVMDDKDRSLNDGTHLIQWDKNNGDNQLWRATDVGNGEVWTFTNIASGKLMDVTGALTDDQAVIVQWESNGGPNQRWRFAPATDGGYKIINQFSGKLLDVFGGSKGNGAGLIQYCDNNGKNQHWLLERVN
jgi:hypothetical protein